MATRETLPAWIAALEFEDLQFIRRFVLASGSLKAMAKEYAVSYPTVRARLDRLIAKIQAAENSHIRDPFERGLRVMVADGSLSETLARRLLQAHRESLRKETSP